MDQEEESSEINVEALLASINANFDADIQEEQQEQQQQSTKSESVIIVRESAIISEQQQLDPIIEILNRVEIQNSLLTNKDINQHQLETGPLLQIIEQIKEKFDKQQESIVKKQRNIFSLMLDIKNLSNQLVQQQQHQGLSKLKINDYKQKEKEIDQLDIQVFKTKGYILSVIERLELMEQNLDQRIDHYVKKKVQELAKC